MKPRIFYFSYRHNVPRGGQKHAYRHVDILSHHGMDAAIVHPGEEGFRLTWFENDTRVLSEAAFMRLVDPRKDLLVLPEDLGYQILSFPGRKVIFNKNIYSGFFAFGGPKNMGYPYQSPEVIAALVVSDHNKELLRLAYPHLMIEKVEIEIDRSIFKFCDMGKKEAFIACSPKAPEILLSVYHVIQARAAAGLNNGGKFEWIFLRDFTEKQTADILGRSLLFAGLSVTEGLGRLFLEAMACGCITVCCGNGPLRDISPCLEFKYADVASIVLFIETVMDSYPHCLAKWENRIASGAAIAERYSLDRQRESVLQAWEKIFQLL